MIAQTKQAFKKTANRFYSPTPKRMRQLGDTIMLAGMGLQTSIMGLPLTDNQKVWSVFIISIVALIGKLMTNFFKEEETTVPDDLQPNT